MLLSALIAFSGFPICYTAKAILKLMNPEETSAITHIRYSIVWFSFAVSRISFYLFMVFRVHYVFRNTSLALSKHALIIHAIIILISPIWIIVMVILQSYEYQTLYQNTSILLIVIMMIGSIHLLYFFNRSLFKMLKAENVRETSMHSTASQSQTNTASDTGITVSREKKRNKALLDTIVKHNLLTSITILMFLIFVIMFGLLSFGLEWNDTQKYLLWWIQCLSINIATFCIFLGFNINNFWYDVICGKCNDCCSSVFKLGDEQNLALYMKDDTHDTKQMSSVKESEATFDDTNQEENDIDVTIDTCE